MLILRNKNRNFLANTLVIHYINMLLLLSTIKQPKTKKKTNQTRFLESMVWPDHRRKRRSDKKQDCKKREPKKKKTRIHVHFTWRSSICSIDLWWWWCFFLRWSFWFGHKTRWPEITIKNIRIYFNSSDPFFVCLLWFCSNSFWFLFLFWCESSSVWVFSFNSPKMWNLKKTKNHQPEKKEKWKNLGNPVWILQQRKNRPAKFFFVSISFSLSLSGSLLQFLSEK